MPHIMLCFLCFGAHAQAQEPLVATVETEIPASANSLRAITWLGIDRTGTLVVRHSGSEPVRRFDAKGRILPPVAIPKGGDIQGVGWLGERLWVWQRGAPSAALYASTGKQEGTASVPNALLLPNGELGPFATGIVGPVPLGFSANGVVLVQALLLANRQGPTEWKQPPGVRSGIFRAREDGVVEGLVAWATPSTVCGIRVPGAQAAAPFCSRPRVLIAPDGSRIASIVAEVTGPDSGWVSVAVTNSRGDSVYSKRMQVALRAVSQAEADSAASALVESIGPMASTDLVRAIHEYRPTVHPPIAMAVFAPDGALWLGGPADRTARHWTVLSPNGATASRYLTPPDLTIWAIRDDIAWATRPGKSGEVALVKLRLRRH